MSATDPAAEVGQLEQAVSHLEAQRPLLGEAVVDAALAPLRARLAELRKAASPTVPAGERRVVTILFSDVTGSTSLAAQLDPEEWAAIMNRIFRRLTDPVEQYGGTVARLMGDGILAFFGAPSAHEDDPERAVLAGLEILHRVRLLREQVRAERGLAFDVRVGINTGLAVVGAVGTESAGEYTALGDAVNLAARMEQTALPGTLQISEATYRLVRRRFEVAALGGIQVKGVVQPVNAYRVLGKRVDTTPEQSALHARVPLVGRGQELALLRQVVADVQAGEGRILLLVGEAGLGKSRLIEELRALRQEWDAPGAGAGRGWRVISSSSYSANQPYGSIQTLIQEIAGIAPEEPAAAVRAKLAVMPGITREGESSLPIFETLLGLHAGAGAEFSGETFRHRLFAATLESVRAEAGGGPFVLVFEDAHWADAASLDLDFHLLELTRAQPALFVFAFRPDRRAPMWQMREKIAREYASRMGEISLVPLADAESAALLAQLFADSGLPAELQRTIQQRAEGNPFFMEEIARAMLEQGVLTADEGRLRWRSGAGFSAKDIPPTIQSLLAARIDRLALDIRRTLQLAAVIGRSFYFRVLARISEAAGELEGHLLSLQEAELVQEAARLPEWEFIFRHALTQEAAYRTLLRGERRSFHERVGRALEALYPERLEELAPTLAIHFSEAHLDEEALRYLSMAGDAAARLHANVEAAEHYRRALDLALHRPVPPDLLRRLYLGLGRALDRKSDQPGAIASYEDMITVAGERGDQELLLAGLNDLATVLSTVNPQLSFERALQLGAQALELSRTLGDPAAEARAHWNLSLAHWYGLGDQRLAVYHGELAEEISRRHGLTEQLAYTLSDLGLAYGGVLEWRRGLAAFAEARSLWRALGDMVMLANNLANSAIGYMSAGKPDTALEVSEEARKITREVRNEWGMISSTLMNSIVMWDYGRSGQAVAQLVYLYTEIREPEGLRVPLAFGDGIVALIAAAMGAPMWAEAQYQRAVEPAEEMPGVMKPWHLAQLSWRALEMADPEQAEAFLGRALRHLSLDGPRSPAHIVTYYARARLLFEHGRYEQAEQALGEMLATFERAEVLWLVPDARYCLGRTYLALGRTGEAQAALRAALELAEAMSCRRVQWQALAQLAGLEEHAERAADYRQRARELIDYIAEHAGYEAIRDGFLALPLVRAVTGER